MRGTDQHVDTRWERLLVVVGIVLLAVNLRAAVTSLGALLDEVRVELGMSASLAGLLTSVPVLCFAGFGFVAPAAARLFGIHRVVFTALVLMVAGLTARALTDSVAVFLLATTVALAAMASGNVVLPALVKLHFPHRIGLLTAVYSTGLVTGAALPAFFAVPVADATGTWRWGLLLWGLTAAVALVPWLGLLRHDVRRSAEEHTGIAWSAVVRSRLAWAMAFFFGVQSTNAYVQFGWLPLMYRDAGLPADVASLLLGVLVLVSVPVPLVLPLLAARWPDQRLIVILFGVLTTAGWLGVLWSADQVPWLWAVLLGLGSGAFPWVLTMLGLRTTSAAGTVALSGFVQSVGYLIAAAGPFLTGLIYGRTESWTVPVALLAASGLPMVLFGLRFARPRFLEDELARSRSGG